MMNNQINFNVPMVSIHTLKNDTIYYPANSSPTPKHETKTPLTYERLAGSFLPINRKYRYIYRY